MSYTITPFSVPIQLMKVVINARSQGLLTAITGSQAEYIARVDAADPEAQFTCAQAIAALINGEVTEEIPGYLYGYSLQAICGYVGTQLSSIGHIHTPPEWIKQIDDILEKKGIPIALSALVYSGSPVAIPKPADYPYIGKWLAREVPPALETLRKLDTTGMSSVVVKICHQVRDWLEIASKKTDSYVIGFLT